MKKNYSLRIITETSKIQQIDTLLGVKSNYNIGGWGLEIVEDTDDEYFDFINFFIRLLDGKYEQLKIIGIERSCISIWLLYEYDDQCNLEFVPNDLKLLGENGISLCISCWNN
jgi:hypothetical protein